MIPVGHDIIKNSICTTMFFGTLACIMAFTCNVSEYLRKCLCQYFDEPKCCSNRCFGRILWHRSTSFYFLIFIDYLFLFSVLFLLTRAHPSFMTIFHSKNLNIFKLMAELHFFRSYSIKNE